MPGRGGGDNGHHCSGADQPTATETLGEVLSNGQRMSSSAAKTSDDGDRDSKNVGKKKKATTSPTLAPAYQHQHQDPQNFTYYHDYYSCSKSATLSLDTIANGAGRLSPLRTASPLLRIHKLPSKLSAMLCNPEFTSIISWMPHGRSWKVHNVHLFLGHVIPHFFEYSNYNSFIRLVNAWGFRRILKGPDRNSYYHEVSYLFSLFQQLIPRCTFLTLLLAWWKQHFESQQGVLYSRYALTFPSHHLLVLYPGTVAVSSWNAWVAWQDASPHFDREEGPSAPFL
jgi:hypothetical protein